MSETPWKTILWMSLTLEFPMSCVISHHRERQMVVWKGAHRDCRVGGVTAGLLPPGDLEMEFLHPNQISNWAIQRADCVTSRICQNALGPLQVGDSPQPERVWPTESAARAPRGPQPYPPP